MTRPSPPRRTQKPIGLLPSRDGSDIREAVERERCQSRYRDRISGVRIHPVAYDINLLLEFVTDRRLRQPGTLPAALRVTRSVDTEALRDLIDIALNRGATTPAIRRCCARVTEYCYVIDAALTLRKRAQESPDEDASFVSACHSALNDVLTPLGHPEATAEVLVRVAQLQYDGDQGAYVAAIAEIAKAVWQQMVDAADIRIKDVESRTLALELMARLPSSMLFH